MIYIEIDSNKQINYMHNIPFDSVNGLGKTEEELLEKGFLIESMPAPERIVGKSALAYYNEETNEVWYEYADIPKSDEEKEIDKLREDMNEAIIELTMLIAMGGM